jgi:hypothetical protein
LATPALIKRINALAEEAGALCSRYGVALASPEAVLSAARETAMPAAALARLEAVFAEIADGKALLAARRAARL